MCSRCKLWLINCNRSDLFACDVSVLHYLVVCEKHFLEDQFSKIDGNIKELKDNAIPIPCTSFGTNRVIAKACKTRLLRKLLPKISNSSSEASTIKELSNENNPDLDNTTFCEEGNKCLISLHYMIHYITLQVCALKLCIVINISYLLP